MLGSIPRRARVLIVEDNEAFAATLTAALQASGAADVRTIRPEDRPEEALGVALEWRADVVVLDIDLHQWWSGVTLAGPLEECGARVILATASPDVALPPGCNAQVYDKAQPWGDLMRMVARATCKPVER